MAMKTMKATAHDITPGTPPDQSLLLLKVTMKNLKQEAVVSGRVTDHLQRPKVMAVELNTRRDLRVPNLARHAHAQTKTIVTLMSKLMETPHLPLLMAMAQ